MAAEVKQTGEENNSGLDWAKRSLVCSFLVFLAGVGGVPGVVLLTGGVLAAACGIIGLRYISKSRLVWYARWMAIGGILLGSFLMIVGLDEIFVPNRAITKAKKVTSLATAIALENAISSIYTEYSRLPDVGSSVTTNSPEGMKLLNILLGLDDKSDNALNSRSIKFLIVKEGKNNKNGLTYAADGKSVEGLYDPWGNPYTVELDTDYNEELHFTIGSRAVDLKGRRAAAYSPGPDRVLGTADDVMTW